jgi:hypothetical protein
LRAQVQQIQGEICALGVVNQRVMHFLPSKKNNDKTQNNKTVVFNISGGMQTSVWRKPGVLNMVYQTSTETSQTKQATNLNQNHTI